MLKTTSPLLSLWCYSLKWCAAGAWHPELELNTLRVIHLYETTVSQPPWGVRDYGESTLGNISFLRFSYRFSASILFYVHWLDIVHVFPTLFLSVYSSTPLPTPRRDSAGGGGDKRLMKTLPPPPGAKWNRFYISGPEIRSSIEGEQWWRKWGSCLPYLFFLLNF